MKTSLNHKRQSTNEDNPLTSLSNVSKMTAQPPQNKELSDVAVDPLPSNKTRKRSLQQPTKSARFLYKPLLKKKEISIVPMFNLFIYFLIKKKIQCHHKQQ